MLDLTDSFPCSPLHLASNHLTYQPLGLRILLVGSPFSDLFSMFLVINLSPSVAGVQAMPTSTGPGSKRNGAELPRLGFRHWGDAGEKGKEHGTTCITWYGTE